MAYYLCVRREQAVVGSRQIGYLISEPPTAAGRQPPVRDLVLLHAFPLSAEMWRPQLEAVRPGWRVVAPDYRGFGASSLGRGDATMSDLAGDVVDLMDHLGMTHAVVLGCSMGGYVALELLASAASYVSGLVMVDTRAEADSEQGREGRRRMLGLAAEAGAEGVAREMTPKLLGDSTRHDRPDLVKHVHRLIASSDPAAIAMAVRAMMNRKDMTRLLSSISVPTMIVSGAEDTLIPFAAAQAMHAAIANSSLETIARAGHLPGLEQPAAFDILLTRFLDRL